MSKALDPTVWPLRVKVREFIHYSKRNSRSSDNQGPTGQRGHQANHGQQQPAAGGHAGQPGRPGQEHAQHQQVQENFVAPNLYDLLPDNDQGGAGLV